MDKEGTRKLAASVRFLDAVMLLSTHPKFSAVVGFVGGNGCRNRNVLYPLADTFELQ